MGFPSNGQEMAIEIEIGQIGEDHLPEVDVRIIKTLTSCMIVESVFARRNLVRFKQARRPPPLSIWLMGSCFAYTFHHL